MENIKQMDIYTNYSWTIKILNKNSFIKNALNFAHDEILFQTINKKLNLLDELSVYNNISLYCKNNEHILNKVALNHDLYQHIKGRKGNHVFNYKVNLNQDYPTNFFLDSFDILIYFDLDTYFVQGGFNWKFNNSWLHKFLVNKNVELNPDFENIETLYISNLIKNFFMELLNNFSYIDFINLIEKKKINNLHHLYIYTNEIYSIEDLYKAWNNLLYKNFFYKFFSDESEFNNYGTEIFDFFSLIFLSYFAIVNELKASFYKKSLVIASTNKKNYKTTDFNAVITNLASSLRTDAYLFIPKKRDYINLVAGLTRDNIFLSKANTTYEIYLNSESNFFTKDFYNNKKDIYLYSLLALYPEFFDIDFASCNIANYDEFYTYLTTLFTSDSLLKNEFKTRIENNSLIDNFNYSCFLRNTSTLLFHGYDMNNLDKEAILRNNMSVANVTLGKELNFRLIHTQWHLGMQGNSIKHKFLYSQVNQEISDLNTLSDLQNKNAYYGEAIIKFNKNFHLKSNVDFLGKEIKEKDEFDKRQRFIEIIILGFIVALLIAIIDYFNMVWSDLACSSSGAGADLWGATPNPNPISPWNTIWSWQSTIGGASGGSGAISRWWSGSTIGFTLFIILINTSILIISLIYLIYARKKNKDIAKRKDVKF